MAARAGMRRHVSTGMRGVQGTISDVLSSVHAAEASAGSAASHDALSLAAREASKTAGHASTVRSGDLISDTSKAPLSAHYTSSSHIDEVCRDLRVLGDDLRDVEALHSKTHRIISCLSNMSIPETTQAPLPSSAPLGSSSPLSARSTSPQMRPDSPSSSSLLLPHPQDEVGCARSSCSDSNSSRTTVPDGPVFTAYQRELAMMRSTTSPSLSRGTSPSPQATPFGSWEGGGGVLAGGGGGGGAGLGAQLEEARQSNRMIGRALTSVQRRLKAVEMERDQLRAERDAFKAIVQKYPFGMGALASLGMSMSTSSQASASASTSSAAAAAAAAAAVSSSSSSAMYGQP